MAGLTRPFNIGTARGNSRQVWLFKVEQGMSAEAACLLLDMSEQESLTPDEALLCVLSRLNLEIPGVWNNDAGNPIKLLQIPTHPQITMNVRADQNRMLMVHIDGLARGICDIKLTSVHALAPSRYGLSMRLWTTDPNTSDVRVGLYLSDGLLVAGTWQKTAKLFRVTCSPQKLMMLVHALNNAPTERELRAEY